MLAGNRILVTLFRSIEIAIFKTIKTAYHLKRTLVKSHALTGQDSPRRCTGENLEIQLLFQILDSHRKARLTHKELAGCLTEGSAVGNGYDIT